LLIGGGLQLARHRLVVVLCVAIIFGAAFAAFGSAAASPGSSLPGTRKIPAGFVTHGVVLDIGAPGSADSVYARFPNVLRDSDGTYKMWYSGFDGSRNRILYATSTDGIAWTKHGVVIDVLISPWNFDSVASQSVMKIDGTYHMWFAAGYWNVPPAGSVQIYHATSADGAAWTVEDVALVHGPPGSWDSVSAHFPAVVRDSSGTYWLYFTGWDGSRYGVGVARSTTFTNFTEGAGNPILRTGAYGDFDSAWTAPDTVLLNGTAWTLYYSGYDGNTTSVGTATSSNGQNWTKSSVNPILTATPSSSWESADADYAAYLKDPTGDRIYYDGGDGTHVRIGLLTQAGSSPGGASTPSGFIVVPLVIVGSSGAVLGLLGWLILRWASRRAPR